MDSQLLGEQFEQAETVEVPKIAAVVDIVVVGIEVAHLVIQ